MATSSTSPCIVADEEVAELSDEEQKATKWLQIQNDQFWKVTKTEKEFFESSLRKQRIFSGADLEYSESGGGGGRTIGNYTETTYFTENNRYISLKKGVATVPKSTHVFQFIFY